MTIKLLLLVLCSVGLSAAAQIVLKLGMSSEAARRSLADESIVIGYFGLLATPAVLVGLAGYGLSALVWLRVLAQLDVSKAYPFVALGIVLTTGLGALALDEVVSPLRALGTAFVVAGVVLIGFS